jgi:hypothetical protein
MDFEFLAQADAATIKLEKAKRALEAAKAELELSKKAYDEMLAQADEKGIPKAKLKKLTEDRIHLLFESGLLEFTEEVTPREPKAKKARTKAAVEGPAEASGAVPEEQAET